MYTDPIEAKYFEKRLRISLEMTCQAVDAGAAMAHRGLAACYRAKLDSLRRIEDSSLRPVLTLGAFRNKRQTMTFKAGRPVHSIVVPAKGSKSLVFEMNLAC